MLEASQAVLVVIDIQGKLADKVYERDKLYANTQAMIKAAQLLGIPIVVTEQVPEKIGFTVDEITCVLGDFQPIIKSSFSCCGADGFIKSLGKRKQILITGIETHVCVYQTIIDLLAQSYEVHLLADATSAVSHSNVNIAVKRMMSEGVKLSSVQMAITELLGGADHPQFREVMKLLKA